MSRWQGTRADEEKQRWHRRPYNQVKKNPKSSPGRTARHKPKCPNQGGMRAVIYLSLLVPLTMRWPGKCTLPPGRGRCILQLGPPRYI